MNRETILATFFAVWLILGLALAVFHWRASFAAKRRWHFWIVFGIGALFLGFVVLLFPDWGAIAFAAVAVFLISLANWKLTRFCPNCGKTLFPTPSWTKMKYCSKCGTRLDGEPPSASTLT
jgi:hypothetical protein